MSVSSSSYSPVEHIAYTCTYLKTTRKVIHELPFHLFELLKSLHSKPDAEIVAFCQHVFADVICESPEAWHALPASYHQRLVKNYVTWIRGYIPSFESLLYLTDEEITRRPITWTIGTQSLAGSFYDNVARATKAGIEIGLLDCKHFPQVTIPEPFADHVKVSALRYL